MNTLAEMLEQGRVQLEAERERLRRAAELNLANKRAKFEREWAVPIAFLKATWPMLADGIVAPVFEPDAYLEGQLPRGTFEVSIDMPGLDRFNVRLKRHAEADGVAFDEPAIYLYRAYEDQSMYGGESYLHRDKRNPVTFESDSLPVALAMAAEQAKELAQTMLEIERKNQALRVQVSANIARTEAAPSDAERALDLVRQLVNLVHVHRDEE